MKYLAIVLIFASLMACTTETKNNTSTETEITQEEETAIVDDITSEVNVAKEELKSTTEEGIKEIDSLLENF